LVRKIRRKHGKQKRLVITLLFSVLICVLSGADDFTGQIILEKASWSVNEEFKLTILVPEISPSAFDIEEPQFPSSLELVKGPFIRPENTGSVIEYFFRPLMEGRFLIESFRIKNSGRTVLTIPVLITASSAARPAAGSVAGPGSVPPRVRWEIPDDKYYTGEAIPLRFVLENTDNADMFIESSIINKPQGLVRKISRFADKYEKTVTPVNVMTEGGAGKIYNILYHDHIFISLESGKIMLPDIEVYLSEGSSGYRKILKGIPLLIHDAADAPPASLSGVNFSFSYEISDKTISPAAPVLITQKISGRGNFYAADVPPPFIDNQDITEITLFRDKYDLFPDGRLFRGSREIIYEVKLKNVSDPLRSEKITVSIPYLSGNGMIKTPGFTEEIIISAAVRPAVSPQGDEAAGSVFLRYDYLFWTAAVLTAVLLPALFLTTGGKRKRFIIASAVVIMTYPLFSAVKKMYLSPPVYGIVQNNSAQVPLLVIPEDTGSVKLFILPGDKIKILDGKDNYYLAETASMEKGWIDKEYIKTE